MATALEEMTTAPDQPTGLAVEGSQYLTFILGEEHYGVDILRVQEIKGYTTVTRIPNTPPYIKGVLNLRGAIVPIVDLRAKFSMDAVEPTMFTVIVVVVVRGRIMGIIVDAVSDVLDIANKDIQPPPEFGSTVDVSFVKGIGKCGERLVTILDIDHVLLDREVAEVAALSAAGS
jgi:purine-binding chemotaxis protein CheW